RPRVVTALAAALAAGGSTDEATGLLRRLVEDAEPLDDVVRGLALSQLGYLLMHLGELRPAAESLARSVDLLRRHDGERDALARVVLNLGYCALLLGEIDRAVERFDEAIELGRETNQEFLVAGCLHNRAYALARLGDLPQALAGLEEALDEYRKAGGPVRAYSALYDDLAETYRLAGLTGDAVDHAATARDLIAGGGNLEQEADATYRLAVCLLDHNDGERAIEEADRARLMFRQADRSLWETRATLVSLESAESGLVTSAERVAAARSAIEQLESTGWHTEALRVRNRMLLIGMATADDEILDRFVNDHPTVIDQSVTAQLERLLHRAIAERWRSGRADGALGEAWDALLTHRRRLADPELRAGSGRLAEAFRFVSLDQAIATGDADEILSAEERWRAASVRLPRARPSADPEVAAISQELRTVTREAAEADEPDPELTSTIHQLEERLRRVSHRSTASDTGLVGADTPIDELGPDDLRSMLVWQLGGRRLTEWFGHRGELLAVDVDAEGTRLRTIGPLSDVRAQATRLRRDLARLLQAPPGVDLAPRWNRLVERAGALGGRLFGSVPTADGLVLCPPGLLQELPWRLLLPAATGDATIAFSATAWLGDEASIGEPRLHLIAGPDLANAADDHRSTAAPIGPIAAPPSARRRDLDRALDDADLLHIAAHGRFRADNPMFSSVRLHDGEFALHELSAYDRVPAVVALAACDAGRSLHLEQGSEQLGPASAWIEAGVETVIAPICAVPDANTATVFQTFYGALPGSTPAEALAAAWGELADADPALAGTAAAFLCFGRGGPRLHPPTRS
ncbi:MAG: CHAT domain-containing protein, partial [Actinomycetota bacterium]